MNEEKQVQKFCPVDGVDITKRRQVWTNEVGALQQFSYCSEACAEQHLARWTSGALEVELGLHKLFDPPRNKAHSLTLTLRQKGPTDDPEVQFLVIDNVRPHDLSVEDNLIGSMIIAGVHFHVELLSVHNTSNETDTIPFDMQEATRDPYKRLDSLFDDVEPDGGFETIEIPELPGRWVLHVYPMSR